MRIQSNARTEKCVCVQLHACLLAVGGQPTMIRSLLRLVESLVVVAAGRSRRRRRRGESDSRSSSRRRGAGRLVEWTVEVEPWRRAFTRRSASTRVNFAPTFPAAAWALGRGARLCLPGIPFPCHRCRRRSLSFNLLPGFGLVFRLARPIRPSSLIRETSL